MSEPNAGRVAHVDRVIAGACAGGGDLGERAPQGAGRHEARAEGLDRGRRGGEAYPPTAFKAVAINRLVGHRTVTYHNT